MIREERKRINFRLSKDLADRFTLASQKIGISKSQLLRNWIDKTNSITLTRFNYTSKQTVSFHFILSEKDERLLLKTAQTFGLPKSIFLRHILQTNLTSSSLANNKTQTLDIVELTKLMNQGEISKLNYLLSKDIESLTNRELLLLVKTKVELSKLSSAKDAIELLSSRLEPETTYPYESNIALLLSQISLSKRNINLTRNLHSKISQYSGYTENIKVNQLGVIHALTGSQNLALESFQKALNYHKINGDVFDSFKNRVFLNYIYFRNEQYTKAKSDLLKLEKQAHSMENNHVNAWYQITKGRYESLMGNYQLSKYHYNKGLCFHRRDNMDKGLAEGYGSLAILELSQNNYDKAIIFLEHAKKSELLFRKLNSDGLTHHLNIFIRSRYDYKEAISQTKYELRKYVTVRTPIIKYLLYSSQYLHGNCDKEKRIGKKHLHMMMINTKYPQLKTAARKTLENKTLSSFAI